MRVVWLFGLRIRQLRNGDSSPRTNKQLFEAKQSIQQTTERVEIRPNARPEQAVARRSVYLIGLVSINPAIVTKWSFFRRAPRLARLPPEAVRPPNHKHA